MSTPQDPGRSEDRPPEQSGYPDAPPPPDPGNYPPEPGQTSHQSYPPPPPAGYGNQDAPTQGGPGYEQGGPGYEQGAPGQPAPGYEQGGPGYGQGAPGQSAPGYGTPGYGQGGPDYGQGAPGYGNQGAPGYGDQRAPGQGAPGQPYPGGQPYAGGPPPAGSSYGNVPAHDPYATPGFGTPPSRPSLPPPKEVVWATYAMYVAIVFSIINVIVTLADSSGFKETIRDANADRNVNVDSVYTGVVVTYVLVTLVISAVYVFLAVNLRKGKSWARTTAFVVVGVFTLLGLLGLANDVPAIVRVLNILVVLANVATLVLLAMRPSSQFFAAMKQPQYPQF